MTESEFIKEKQKILKSMPDTICFARGEAESILEELGQYRAIGTVKYFRECANILKESETDNLSKIIDEWLLYQKIGTVEECREAREKQKAEAPDIYEDGYKRRGGKRITEEGGHI